MSKIWYNCKEEKFFDEFDVRKSSKDGLANWCKSCKKNYNKEYRKKNIEKIREREKKHKENESSR